MTVECIRMCKELYLNGVEIGDKVPCNPYDGNEIKITSKYGKNMFVSRAFFLYFFKPVDFEFRMAYDEFEYILVNYIFKDAVFHHNSYNSSEFLIIQGYIESIMISINSDNVIRVSFPDRQEVFNTCEDALDSISKRPGIINYK